MDEDLVAFLREAFGWHGEIAAAPGPRGALGRIWRLETGGARYALKEIFAEPPSGAVIEAELAFSRLAARAGVRMPASYADRDGRHLLTAPDGTWLRLYEWMDLRPAQLAAPATPGEVGALLARLHRCAPTTAEEPGGGPPDHWYDRVPPVADWPEPPAAGPPWTGRLAEVLAALPELCAPLGPADPATLVLCHRDLHPENVLAAILLDPAAEPRHREWATGEIGESLRLLPGPRQLDEVLRVVRGRRKRGR
ncbi:phosphotransferase enzyme family protein [Nonomuraea sp. NPDC050783]|uniref:phosphotransferase enzyme family protein n=1 Tax=Nonomuraea sp. NPDC050783 TaxID=3154634 RepID=UPI0034657C6F